MEKASGTFQLKMTPIGDAQKKPGVKLASLGLEKHYVGDLEAVATGQMLSAVTDVKGSASYVALEYVEGKLAGKTGGFALQHHAWMTKGERLLKITVVPDSGTGELKGLKGQLDINIEAGQHFYQFDYEISS